MNITKTVLSAALCAVSFLAAAASAQVGAMNTQDTERGGSNVIFFEGRSVAGFVAITYSAPQWKDAYDQEGALDQYKGMGVRLGKNWWTKLDSTVALQIGGKKLEAGSYVLGLHITKEGDLHLVAIDAAFAIKQGMMPWDSSTWKNETHMPLKLEKNKLDESHKAMEIAIVANEKNTAEGMFTVRWGKHELSAPVKFHVHGAKDAAHEKNDKK